MLLRGSVLFLRVYRRTALSTTRFLARNRRVSWMRRISGSSFFTCSMGTPCFRDSY